MPCASWSISTQAACRRRIAPQRRADAATTAEIQPQALQQDIGSVLRAGMQLTQAIDFLIASAYA
jgi:hypothetical protein